MFKLFPTSTLNQHTLTGRDACLCLITENIALFHVPFGKIQKKHCVNKVLKNTTNKMLYEINDWVITTLPKYVVVKRATIAISSIWYMCKYLSNHKNATMNVSGISICSHPTCFDKKVQTKPKAWDCTFDRETNVRWMTRKMEKKKHSQHALLAQPQLG